MFLNNTEKELVNKLKGRISRALSIQTKLSKEEKTCMEGIYNAIDKVLVGHKEYPSAELFKEDLTSYSFGLKSSKRKFIKEHIVPLVTKIATRKWGEDE